PVGAQLLLQPSLHADVADDRRVDHAVRYLRAGHRQLDREDLAALAPRLHLADAADGARDARLLVAAHVVAMLFAIRRGHEHLDGLADHLARRVSEDG